MENFIGFVPKSLINYHFMVSKSNKSNTEIIYTHYGVIQFGLRLSIQMKLKVLWMTFSLYTLIPHILCVCVFERNVYKDNTLFMLFDH